MTEAEIIEIMYRSSVETVAGLALLIAVAIGGLIWMYRQPRTKHQKFHERF